MRKHHARIDGFPAARYELVKNKKGIISCSERVIAHLRSVCLHRLSSFHSDSLCCSQECINKATKLSLYHGSQLFVLYLFDQQLVLLLTWNLSL